MRRKYLAGLTVLLAVVAATAFGYVHPFGNPRIERPKGRNTLLQHSRIPADARAVLVNKCADCHSNETQWPAYARMAPGSWLIERDIVEARKHMDFSHWDQLSAEDQQVLLKEISHEAKSGDMPPPQYVALHWGADLTATEVQTLAKLGNSDVHTETAITGSGNATRGKAVFDKRCTGCHSTEINGEGPRLGDVYGRKAGSVTGFDYSQGLKKSGIVWDETTLNKWLSGPDAVVPDTAMDFYVPRAAERQDLIAYFKLLKVGS
jgi:cytochrome c